MREGTIYLGVFSSSTTLSLSTLLSSSLWVVYSCFTGPFVSKRSVFPEDEDLQGEQTPLLESRRLWPTLRQVRCTVLPCRGLLQSRWMRFAGLVDADLAGEYAVCRAKRSEHAALVALLD